MKQISLGLNCRPRRPTSASSSKRWTRWFRVKAPGATKTLTLDALQRPLSIEVRNTASTALLASRYYQYDKAGNITQINSDLGLTQYGYDNLDRLTKAQPDQSLQNFGLPVEQYSYDPVHNRTSSGHQQGTWSYNADNQLTRYPYLKPFTPGAQPLDTAVSFTPQGHTSEEKNAQEQKRYVYNAAERLVGFEAAPRRQASPSVEAQYRYDPMGRRISKSVKQGQPSETSTTYFVYTDTGLMGELNEAGEVKRAYAFNPATAQQGMWSTDPIWQAESKTAQGSRANLANQTETAYHYLQTDHLGTPMLAVDAAGQTSWRASMEAFGSADVDDAAEIEMNLRFPGQYFDVEKNNHYNFFRDYQNNTGRYIQVDFLGVSEGVNLYSYSELSPLIKFDSMGTSSETKCIPDDKTKKCLDLIFSQDTAWVMVLHDPAMVYRHFGEDRSGKQIQGSTTRPNTVYTSIVCNEFFKLRNHVLHEYYHVIHQWSAGMTRYGYLLNHKKYEKETQDFADKNIERFNKCVNTPCS